MGRLILKFKLSIIVFHQTENESSLHGPSAMQLCSTQASQNVAAHILVSTEAPAQIHLRYVPLNCLHNSDVLLTNGNVCKQLHVILDIGLLVKLQELKSR